MLLFQKSNRSHSKSLVTILFFVFSLKATEVPVISKAVIIICFYSLPCMLVFLFAIKIRANANNCSKTEIFPWSPIPFP